MRRSGRRPSQVRLPRDPDVYIKRFPDGASVPVSTQGGTSATWSLTGDTLFYYDGQAIVAATLSLSDPPTVLERQRLLTWLFAESNRAARNYDVHPEGFVTTGSAATTNRIIVRTRLPVGEGR